MMHLKSRASGARWVEMSSWSLFESRGEMGVLGTVRCTANGASFVGPSLAWIGFGMNYPEYDTTWTPTRNRPASFTRGCCSNVQQRPAGGSLQIAPPGQLRVLIGRAPLEARRACSKCKCPKSCFCPPATATDFRTTSQGCRMDFILPVSSTKYCTQEQSRSGHRLASLLPLSLIIILRAVLTPDS